MDLKNFESFVATGLPVSGATVEVREASDTHPNTGGVIASTTTNADGMWQFAGLTDTPKDVKVTYLNNVWWYKGNSKHSVAKMYFETPVALSQSLVRNGGLESARDVVYPLALSTSPQTVFDNWSVKVGAGSSGTITTEAAIVATGSLQSAKIAYTHVAGGAEFYQRLLSPVAIPNRSKQIYASIQVRQGVSSNVRPFIRDSVGTTYGSASATTGSFVSLTVTRTIDAAATYVEVGVIVDGSDTVYIDNVILVQGTTAPVFQPDTISAARIDASDLAQSAVTTPRITDSAVTTAKIADLNVTTAKLADAAVTETKIGTQAVNTGNIKDNAVTATKILDATITGAKIANDTITATQIAPNAIAASELADNSVDTAAIVNDAVTTAKVANLAITGAKIANDTITATQIAANAIGASELADNSVDTAAIVDGAVTAAKIAGSGFLPLAGGTMSGAISWTDALGSKIRFYTGYGFDMISDGISVITPAAKYFHLPSETVLRFSDSVQDKIVLFTGYGFKMIADGIGLIIPDAKFFDVAGAAVRFKDIVGNKLNLYTNYGIGLDSNELVLFGPSALAVKLRQNAYNGALIGTVWHSGNYPNPLAPLIAYGTTDQTATTSLQDVTGASITLNKAGKWVIIGSFDLFQQGAGDVGAVDLRGTVNINGVDNGVSAKFHGEYTVGGYSRANVAQVWTYTAATDSIIAKLRFAKNAGTGTSGLVGVSTSITAFWIGP